MFQEHPMDIAKFRNLSLPERALVAIAVLLDGREASVYLENDAQRGKTLGAAANALSMLDPELRMAYTGTSLRRAFNELLNDRE